MTPPLLAAAVLLVVPVPFVLRFVEAPAWLQLTLGSSYNWAVLLCFAGHVLNERRSLSTAQASGDDVASVSRGPGQVVWWPSQLRRQR
jgi:hypothetical protein